MTMRFQLFFFFEKVNVKVGKERKNSQQIIERENFLLFEFFEIN